MPLGRGFGVLAPALDPPVDERAAAVVGAHRDELVVDLPGVEQVARVGPLAVLRQAAEQPRDEQRRVRRAVRERVERAAQLGVGREQEHALGAARRARGGPAAAARAPRAARRGGARRDRVAVRPGGGSRTSNGSSPGCSVGRTPGSTSTDSAPVRVVLGQVAREEARRRRPRCRRRRRRRGSRDRGPLQQLAQRGVRAPARGDRVPGEALAHALGGGARALARPRRRRSARSAARPAASSPASTAS